MKLLLIQISQFYGYFLFPRAKYSSQHFLSNLVRSPDTAAVVGPIFVVLPTRFFLINGTHFAFKNITVIHS
jgi:hypothetical protein